MSASFLQGHPAYSSLNLKLPFGGSHRIPAQLGSTSRVSFLIPLLGSRFQRSHLSATILHSSSVRGGDRGRSPAPLPTMPTAISHTRDGRLIVVFGCQVYDWILLFDREVEHIWRREWNVSKILYLLSRYGPFIDAPINLASKSDPAVV